MKTKKEVRESFWQMLKEVSPELASQRRTRKTQNDYCTDIRCRFVDYVDALRRDGTISEKLCNNVTL